MGKDNSITFHEMIVDYIHESDWTSKISIDRERLVVSPFSSYISSEGEIEISTVKVHSKEELKILEKTLKSHWKIKRILFLYPINDGYPKVLRLGVIGDLRDSVRGTAYTLGAIADSSLYYETKEKWSILFMNKYSVDAMRRFLEIHGKVLSFKVKEFQLPVDVLSRYEFKNRSLFTDREIEVLMLAYERGLFEYPKKNKIEDVARELGVTKASLNEVLRKTLKKIIKNIVSSLDDYFY